MLPACLFLLAAGPILSFFVPSRNFCCREVLLGFIVAKPLGFVNLPIHLGPSLDHSEGKATMAWHLPLMTLRLLVNDEGCFGIRVAVGLVEGKASGVGEIGVVAIPEEGVGSSPIIDPSFVGTVVTQADGSILTLHGEEVILGEDPSV